MQKPKPFTIAVENGILNRIATQVANARIGYAPAGDSGDWRYGMDAAYLAALAAYWRDEYDWRAAEARLNRWPQFLVEVDGIDIHFQHIHGSGGGRMPVIMTHGWPGSFMEFQDVIERLAFPERFGGRAEDGLDLVIPSLPGFGFSGRPKTPLGGRGVAALWRRLMTEVLGYPKFGSQGGDWGAVVTHWLGLEHAEVMLGMHFNLILGPPAGPEDDSQSLAYRSALHKVQQSEGGYMHVQATKPQTIGLALHDNPVGTAAWIIEKFHRWGDTKGNIESSFSKDTLLTNLMIYLVNDAVISSFWAYYGNRRDPVNATYTKVPTGIAVFPGEFYPMPSRRDAERLYNIVRWTEMPAGGHFAALEKPQAFASEVAAFFNGL